MKNSKKLRNNKIQFLLPNINNYNDKVQGIKK